MAMLGMETPSASSLAGSKVAMTPEQYQSMRWDNEIAQRNRPLSDEELDSMLPPEGYRILAPPEGYDNQAAAQRKLMGTPTPFGATPMYQIPEEDRGQKFDVAIEVEGLPDMKPEDQQYFGKLLQEVRAGLAL